MVLTFMFTQTDYDYYDVMYLFYVSVDCSVYNLVLDLKTTTEQDRTAELYESLWEYIHKYKFIRIILRIILHKECVL